MSDGLHKFAVSQRFHRAAAEYDGLAVLQRASAMQLAMWLPQQIAHPGPWLDAGCGTGQAQPLLMPPESVPLIGLDIAQGMLQQARARAGQLIQGDIEHLPFAAGALALYWSNLAWQWCALPRAMSEAARVLGPGGQLCVATLGPGTLAELRAAFDGLDDAQHVIDFETADTVEEAARQAGFHHIEITTQTLTAWQPDLSSILRTLKGLGAAEVGDKRRRGLMGLNMWRTLEARYEQHRSNEGLPVRYDVIFLRAQRTP
jgi:malonyl-CoA O-methyltransferase